MQPKNFTDINELFKERLDFDIQEGNSLDSNGMSVFPHRIRNFMNLYDLSGSDVSRLTNIDKSLIAKYINGILIPKDSTIVRIAEAVGANADWLLGKSSTESGFRAEIHGDDMGYYENKRMIIALMIYEYSKSKRGYIDKYQELISILSTLNEDGIDKILSLGSDLTLMDKYNLRSSEHDLLSEAETLNECLRYQKINLILGNHTQTEINQDFLLDDRELERGF
jgi:transcriptional regulator with XRE-family HTH domain